MLSQQEQRTISIKFGAAGSLSAPCLQEAEESLKIKCHHSLESERRPVYNVIIIPRGNEPVVKHAEKPGVISEAICLVSNFNNYIWVMLLKNKSPSLQK